ncbi:hypothetical protein CANARDRAFT_25584 [[Candida] arabinofermentans NRRL YB-2248]|uniref:SEC7 domain-containing protein n=1 Tax=[Candida] arabinofermentans NRRL YB-2248 TaxID=983967 RepID=A0A1E4STI9_9ASCO|nr:hypothetical protein CANARDRAFT_25584 [[Candida] arabinofermentans NRRL YB-2248]
MPTSDLRYNGTAVTIEMNNRAVNTNGNANGNANGRPARQHKNSPFGSWESLKSKIKTPPLSKHASRIRIKRDDKYTRTTPPLASPIERTIIEQHQPQLVLQKDGEDDSDNDSDNDNDNDDENDDDNDNEKLDDPIDRHRRVESISSSLSSEKGSITRSLSRIKQRTKSLLSLDPSSSNSMKSNELLSSDNRPPPLIIKRTYNHYPNHQPSQPNSPAAVQFTLSDDTDENLPISPRKSKTAPLINQLTPDSSLQAAATDRQVYKRSLSYNDKDESEPSETTNATPKPSIVIIEPHKATLSRQRSKTLNALDNPLDQLTGGMGSGGIFTNGSNGNGSVLNSITNFMKNRRSISGPSSTTTLKPTTTYNNLTTKEPDIKRKQQDILKPKPEQESPDEYLDKLLKLYPVTSIASIVSLNDSQSLRLCFREYLNRYFNFKDEPMDVSLRKFLMLNELPKESQQIDRVIYEFAKHYCDQNPGIGSTIDSCYIVTFSLIMLHTDRFNPNNKRKMTKMEFLENLLVTLEQNEETTNRTELSKLISKEILECYFDNIVHIPFVTIPPEQSDEVLESFNDPSKLLPYPTNSMVTQLQSSTSMPSSASPLIVRKRSSTFLWNSLPVDPYDYIIKQNINDLKMNLEFNEFNPFVGFNSNSYSQLNNEPKLTTQDWIEQQIQQVYDPLDLRTYHNLKKSLTGSHCSAILKIRKSKGGFLINNNKTEVIPYGSTVDPDYLITRIFKIGMISKQENKVLSTTKPWKRYFCILTSSGLFFYKNLSYFKMVYTTNSKSEKIIILEETVTNSLLESFEPTMIIPNGSFAIRMSRNLEMDMERDKDTGGSSSNQRRSQSSGEEEEELEAGVGNDSPSSLLQNKKQQQKQLTSCTFYIYARNSKDVYMVANAYELSSWITSINYLSTLDPLTISIKPLDLGNLTELDTYGEVLNLRTSTTIEKITSLKHHIDAGFSDLKEYLVAIKRLKLLTPFNTKTKDSLIVSSKLLNVKIEWLWFEQSRNCMMLELLKVHLSEEENMTRDEVVGDDGSDNVSTDDDDDANTTLDDVDETLNDADDLSRIDEDATLQTNDSESDFSSDIDEEYVSALNFSIAD